MPLFEFRFIRKQQFVWIMHDRAYIRQPDVALEGGGVKANCAGHM